MMNNGTRYIKFKNESYPVREIDLDEFGHVLIATIELNNKLFTLAGQYICKTAQFIDEKIFYFVENNQIELDAEALCNIVSGEVL